ncbi:MAG: phosphate ABC transporter substrate-binding protein PstS [Candidatus Kapabacteria bacterium]|nr:phosphate ABC transporter substrate-binding protein PstS [Candidatus Kapabacteria bacterium]
MINRKAFLALAAALFAIVSAMPAAAQLQINGAGATFPYVLYSKWFEVYKNKTGIQFNYQSIGSGGGIKQITEGTVDFGASDGAMTDEQIATAKSKQGRDILHIPMTLGAVVLTFNVPGVTTKLKLKPAVIPDIFAGIIKKWNDPRIKESNPGVTLPDMAIIVVHRSDGSGTTAIFTDYLCKVSGYWQKTYGKGTSVNWAQGTLGAKGNEGVAGQVKQTKGSIGYVELAYAVQNKLEYAEIQNKSGKYVLPTIDAVTEAANGSLVNIPADLRASITDPDKGGYPIAGMTWLLIYNDQKDQAKGKAIVDFLQWAIKDGQAFCKDLHYAPLPQKVVDLCMKKIGEIGFGGKPYITPVAGKGGKK